MAADCDGHVSSVTSDITGELCQQYCTKCAMTWLAHKCYGLFTVTYGPVKVTYDPVAVTYDPVTMMYGPVVVLSW